MSAPNPVTPRQPGRALPRRGFALIIVISLLALLIMVLVSLATLTRIEAGVGANSLKQAQAQQNARFALELAIGELQRHAGPDQRVTATAEVLGGSLGQRHWMGVWETGVGRSWLVSGNEQRAPSDLRVDPTLTAGPLTTTMTVDSEVTIGGATRATLLVGPNSAGTETGAQTRYVVAPLMDIEGTTADGETETVGRYAWWVGDEGVKARANLRDKFSEFGSDTPGGRARHRLPQRVAAEAVVGFSALPINVANTERVLTRSQLSFVGSGTPGPASVRNRFHDVTTFSAGVLADVRAGGLKKDLSAFLEGGDSAAMSAISGEEIAEDVALEYARTWANLAPNTVGFERTAEPRAPVDETQHGLHPVIVRHSQFFGVSYDEVARQFRIHYMPLIVLWNPFDVGLAEHDYVIEISMPFQLECAGDEISATFAVPSTMWLVVSSADFEPGECRVFSANGWSPFSEPSPSGVVTAQLTPGWRPRSAFYFGLFGSFPQTTPGAISIKQPAPGGLTGNPIQLKLGGQTDSPVVQRIASGDFDSYAPQVSNDHHERVVISASTAVSEPALLIYPDMIAHGWHIARSNTEGWLGIEHEGQPIGTWINVASGAGRVETRAFTGFSWLSPSNASTTTSGQTHAQLFGIPRISEVPVLSAAEFNNVQVPDFTSMTWRPRLLWEGGAGPPTTGIWDRYFFTGFSSALQQSDIDDPDYVPAFSRLRFVRNGGRQIPRGEVVLDTDVSESKPVDTAAANVLVDGMFNINSTSREAWRALFHSFAGVPVRNGSGTDEPSSARHPFARSAYPWRESVSPTDAQNSAEIWSGYRSLTDDQVNDLADDWTDRVAEVGPYASLDDFVNDPMWDAIIAGAGINNPSWEGILAPAAGARVPGHLSKWDVLARLLPVLNVRSDTFLIRTYGESVNPVTGETEARAWCEAVVQRMPEYVDPDNAPWDPAPGGEALSPTNAQFGRRFQIVYFRWLTPADI